MGSVKVTVIEGDGIGPEVVRAALKVLETTGIPFEWEFAPAGESAMKTAGSYLPETTLESIDRNRVALKGPTNTPDGEGHRSVNVRLREHFELFANIRTSRTLLNVKSPFQNVDIVCFRETTEDLYCGEERLAHGSPDLPEALSRISRCGVERFARYAFDYAKACNRSRVTVVHKANILKLTHGLFLAVAREAASECPNIAMDDMHVDNLAKQLVEHPERFDCLLMPNMIGDTISGLCAGLTGGLGIAPGSNIGKHHAIFEATHGTAPDIAGSGTANPAAIMLSGAMMLKYLGYPDTARKVHDAVTETIAHGVATADVPLVNRKRTATTNEFADAVIQEFERLAALTL